MKRNYCVGSLATALILLLTPQLLFAAYKPVAPRELKPGAVAVTKPGNYTKAGTTYVLMKDISSKMTPIFLGKDVTLDLNGHTVTFADGDYERIPNSGFEEGLKDWDTSQAPGAKIVSTIVRPLVGKKFCLLPEGQEIVSKYITLPVANRSYYAMCALSNARGGPRGAMITITVEDELGNPVRCEFTGGSKPPVRVSCPLEATQAKLGGGTLFAHLHYLPAGRYRIRIEAVSKDCQIDQADIRPAFDVGVAVLGRVAPWATYQDKLKDYPCEFFDYCKKNGRTPVDSVPVVSGAGEVTIKNGIIKNGSVGARSFGILSNAREVTLKLENVKVLNAGLDANAVLASKAIIKNCRFEVDTPFIINRHHTTSDRNVQLGKAVEISHSEFIGGQGSLSTRGGNANIHDNLFVNAQTVTNHYSISPCTGDKIYNNRFEPRIGSGIYIYRMQNVEVYNNVFEITAAPPNSEYRYAKYSTNAIRLRGTGAKPGGKGVCENNRIYQNKIHVQAKAYPEYKGYKPHAYAFFISVPSGTNYIYDNEITVENNESDPNASAYAFFIGSSNNGGEIYNNKVTTNCSIAWIGNSYGSSKNTKFYNNTFIRAENTLPKYKAFILGNGGNTAENIDFFSNTFQGWKDLFSYHTHLFSYSMGWTLTVKPLDKNGKQIKNRQILIRDKDGKEVVKLNTDEGGVIQAMLPEYVVTAKGKKVCSTYTVSTGKIEMNEIQQQIQLTEDMTVELREE